MMSTLESKHPESAYFKKYHYLKFYQNKLIFMSMADDKTCPS